MQTRISGSSFTRSQASVMIASISPDSALRASRPVHRDDELVAVLLDEAVGCGLCVFAGHRAIVVKNENVF